MGLIVPRTALLRPDVDHLIDEVDNSCMLYAPLYKLPGEVFYSRDRGWRKCTNTGTIWIREGRSFDGIDDYLSIPASADWNFAGDFTISVWFKLDINNRNLVKSASDEDWNAASANDWVFDVGGDDIGRLYIKGGTTSETSSTISTGSWHSLAVTRRGSAIRLHLNGKLDTAVSPSSTATLGNTQALQIGRNEVNLDGAMDGLIGEVSIYTHAQAASEIFAHYLAARQRYL